jgi:hypothetical protein
MTTWNLATKPPATTCPQHYCFFWREAGDWTSPGLYLNLEEALQNLQPVQRIGCGCSFGRCTRLEPVNGDHDWYEPAEPILEQDGLPWFYFIPSPDKLAELREKYIVESEALWGKEHWKSV